MDSTPLALLTARAATLAVARSAEPGAPVVEPRPQRHPRLRRTRTRLAAGLHRFADVVGPVEPSAPCSVAH